MADYTWDTDARVFRDAADNPVAQETIYAWIAELEAEASKRIGYLTGQLIAEDITTAEWELEIAKEVKLLHTVMGTIAAGGEDQFAPGLITGTDRETVLIQKRVETSFRFEFTKLKGLWDDIQAGNLSDAQIAARAQLYLAGGYKTYANAVREAEIAKGRYDEERRMDARDEKECNEGEPNCWDSGRFWAPIGSLPEIGACTCINNCRCYFEYRKKPENKKRKYGE